MQEMYGPSGDEALDRLKQAWAEKYGLKLDIEHTGELPPYRRANLEWDRDWDLIVWQTKVYPAAAGPGRGKADAKRLESRISWLTQWAAEKTDRVVVIEEAEAFEKLHARTEAGGRRQAGMIIAGEEELPAGWLAMQQARATDTAWIVSDINGAVYRKAGWFDARDECQKHIREHIDSEDTREYDLDSMYEPGRITLEKAPGESGVIWVRVKPDYEELDQGEKGYPSREACAEAEGGDGLTPKPIERHPGA